MKSTLAAAAVILVVGVAACSAPPRRQIVLRGTSREAASHFYPRALRLAARGRIQSRAGDDALAAEYFRAAYHAHPDVGFLLEYAQACDRARFFAESRAAYAEALHHSLGDDRRKQVAAEVERLGTLVPKGKVPVAVQVRPRRAKALLERTAVPAGTARKPKPMRRTVIGDAKIWLYPGTYRIAATARGFDPDARTFRIKPSATDHGEGLLVNLTLAPTARVELGLARGGKRAGAVPGKRSRRPTAENKPPREKRGEAAEEPEEGGDRGPGAEDEQEEGGEAEQGADQEAEDASDGGASSGSGTSGGLLRRWGPIATLGAGVLALGGGGALWYLALDNKTQAEAVDPKLVNRKELFDFHAGKAESYWKARVVALGVGGALVTAGAIWWAVAPKSYADASRRGPGNSLVPSSLDFDGRIMAAVWRF